MVRFSCFSTPPVNRSQKVAQHSAVTLQSNYPNVTKDQSIELVKGSVRSSSMLDNYSTSPRSQRNSWRSNGQRVKFLDDEQKMLQKIPIKRSLSLGNILERENGYSGDDTAEDSDIGHGYSFDLLNDWNMREVRESSDNNTNSTENLHLANDGKYYKNQLKENNLIKSIDIFTEDPMHNEILFSAEVLKQPDRDWHAANAEQAVDYVANSSGNIPILSRSYSVANFRANTSQSGKNAGSRLHIFRRSRSFSDLNKSTTLELGLQNGDNYFDSGGTVEKNVIISSTKNLDLNGQFQPYYDTKEGDLSLVKGHTIMDHNTDGKILTLRLDKDKKAACNLQYNANIADVLGKSEANEMVSSCFNWEQLTPQELSMRRVESWISQIDIHGDLIVEEQGDSSTSVSKEELQNLDDVPPKPDSRSTLAMEVAYNYISSLTSSSSSAQMANLGLITVPILSSFVSLRVLNLSGNSIVHITPGSLPKGLHMLNLSKNKISAIEGLRDLSRLRVLDLNYNRIAKMGHGLASCSSIKELYLAGNKISEVEGLHRLLKLNILDLRFNRISTAKGLGQLAANYGSLQAINLEGNPAQRNVGDEQLRKFLLGLLPNLVYYNKQAIRMTTKEASVRAERAAASPQFDRGNLSRRGSLGTNLNQLASHHGQQIAAATPSRKPSSKERHVRVQLPPASSALTKMHSDAGRKTPGLSATDAMKRSRSIGGLGSIFKS
ncbi:hypothetical protein KSP40_PGU010696 [Platanthera guangdongensis]|uniref:Uncharacterized protein n=1 Tax=Platanthera guangdongensis TaxID=2320717 RepID=A0ABR2LYL3_9ASPA